ncbi:MAG TPA: SIMPL domain-containing protein [Armatimonadota bacterium]|jgi:hypothetical protein
MRRVLVVGLLGAALGGRAVAQSAPGPLISVVGEATVERKPDLVTFTMGVVAKAATIETARAAAAAKMAAALRSLEKAGVKRTEIETSEFSVSRVWDPTVGPLVRGRHAGAARYRVSNTLSVSTARVAEAGHIVDTALRAGLNDVYGPSYRLKDKASAQREALAAAFGDAKAKAIELVAAAGRRIGAAYRITESGASEPGFAGETNYASNSFANLYRASGAPYNTAMVSGKVEVTANVSVSFMME